MGLKKLFTALRGAGNEVIESIEDSQAIRILDQEIREATEELNRSNKSLTTIMAKRKLVERTVDGLKADVDKYSQLAINASESGQNDLAIECAEKVSELETSLATEQATLDQYLQNETSLKASIAKANTALKKMRQQVDQVKANEQVQKARAAVTQSTAGSNGKMTTALDSLERIKRKQAQQQAELDAADELANDESGATLDARLKDAGVLAGGSVSGQDKLAQLLASKNAGA